MYNILNENGEPFIPAFKGDDGKSAYEIAVENGFVGTEEQWLESLKGAEGVDGIKTTKTNIQTRLWNYVADDVIIGANVWTDGERIYYSYDTEQLELNLETGLWEEMLWNGLSDFRGSYIWTDGENVYYSRVGQHYVLNKSTKTWVEKVWNIQVINGNDIWTDGEDIYHSPLGGSNFVLNKDTGEFDFASQTGIAGFNGANVWTDGVDVYYSDPKNSAQTSFTHYVLDKGAGQWQEKEWQGLGGSPQQNPQISGIGIWTDGNDIYHSRTGYGLNLILNKDRNSWSPVEFTGIPFFLGSSVWTNGFNTYLSNSNGTFLYSKSITVNAKPVLK